MHFVKGRCLEHLSAPNILGCGLAVGKGSIGGIYALRL